MKLLKVFLIVIFLCSSVMAQDVKGRGDPKPPMNLVFLNTKWRDEVKPAPTGIAVSPNRVVTTYHTGKNLEPILLKIGGQKGRVVAADPEYDYLVLEFEGEPFKGVEPVKMGPPVRLGEHIVCWGNPIDRGPVYREFVVAKIELGYVLVDRPFVHGESGAGCYNASNELIGMISCNMRQDNVDLTLENAGDELGTFVPVQFFKQHIPSQVPAPGRKP